MRMHHFFKCLAMLQHTHHAATAAAKSIATVTATTTVARPVVPYVHYLLKETSLQ
jgi:hypothetical protein